MNNFARIAFAAFMALLFFTSSQGEATSCVADWSSSGRPGAAAVRYFGISGVFYGEQDTSGEDTSAFSPDSLEDEKKIEHLAEQSAESEDSPLLDFLASKRADEDWHLELRSRLGGRIQEAAGFRKGLYIGSPLKSYQRVKLRQSRHLSCGILLKKDAGEARFDDFTSANIQVSDVGFLSSLVIGDYVIETGQGLSLWRSTEAGKGAEVILPVKRKASGLKGNFSAGENGFFRGIASDMRFQDFSILLFSSSRARSASLDINGNVTGFSAGCFRTAAEIEKRDNVRELLFGTRCGYLSKTFTWGITLYRTSFSRDLVLDNPPVNQGSRFSMISADYLCSLPYLSFFGEWALAKGVPGGSSGLLISPARGVDIICSFRFYSAGFSNLHGSGFGERNSAEKGFYTGLKLRIFKDLKISSFYDQFNFQEPGVFPSPGNDVLIEAEYNFTSHVELTCRYRRKKKETMKNIPNPSGLLSPLISGEQRHYYRFNAECRLSEGARIRWRFDHLRVESDFFSLRQEGTTCYADLACAPIKPVWANFRISFFGSDSFDAGLSEYESDLAGVLTQPVLFGSGASWHMILKYIPSEVLEISLKYSDCVRDDVKRVGSGPDELPGRRDSRLGFQVDAKF